MIEKDVFLEWLARLVEGLFESPVQIVKAVSTLDTDVVVGCNQYGEGFVEPGKTHRLTIEIEYEAE